VGEVPDVGRFTFIPECDINTTTSNDVYNYKQPVVLLNFIYNKKPGIKTILIIHFHTFYTQSVRRVLPHN